MSTDSTLRPLIGALHCVLLLSCSLTTDADREQCLVDSDCAARGPAFAGSICVDAWCTPEPKWSCLDVPPTVSSVSDRFAVTLRVQDILTQQPMAGVQVELCRRADANCEVPQAAPTMSDDRGVARFEIQSVDPVEGFTGFARFTRGDIMPGLYFFNPPLEGSSEVPPIELLKPAVVGALIQQIGASLDNERGLVLLSTFDCQDEPAPGVALTTDGPGERSEIFYSVDGLPQSTASATDNSGYAGLINVTPGKLAITGRLKRDRRLVGTVNLIVRPGSITYSRMVPHGR